MSQATTELVWFPNFNFIYLSVDFLSYSGITANHPAIGLSRPALCNGEKNHSSSCDILFWILHMNSNRNNCGGGFFQVFFS